MSRPPLVGIAGSVLVHAALIVLLVLMPREESLPTLWIDLREERMDDQPEPGDEAASPRAGILSGARAATGGAGQDAVSTGPAGGPAAASRDAGDARASPAAPRATTVRGGERADRAPPAPPGVSEPASSPPAPAPRVREPMETAPSRPARVAEPVEMARPVAGPEETQARLPRVEPPPSPPAAPPTFTPPQTQTPRPERTVTPVPSPSRVRESEPPVEPTVSAGSSGRPGGSSLDSSASAEPTPGRRSDQAASSGPPSPGPVPDASPPAAIAGESRGVGAGVPAIGPPANAGGVGGRSDGSAATGESVGGAPGAGGGVGVARVAPGVGAGQAGAEYGPYLRRLRGRIQDVLRYPPSARRRGVAGTVTLEITIQPTGIIRDVAVVESSSHPVLDEAAVGAVRALRPQPFPPDVASRPVRVRVPVVFDLR